ncbi:uncharacterized protein LOC117596080 [Pangasianodon hypophthalmus]|uniref:uncharacterized protein LOC117596080 n=1 Tax=Pangasianodon hypophthalmus TaxID=310915 RepID=UPI002307EA54|nr:uncharacterized protein LOC117596080 [Pangasianodon hypophthalmus]
MKILHIHFYLLVCCGAAESFTEKSVDLGQNVTVKCEVSVRDVHWFLMKPSEPPLFILRSFSSRSLRTDYSNPAFSKTFSLQFNSSLFIHNISTNELGVYYCIQPGSPPNISSGIRLYTQNHSAVNQTWKIEVLQNQTAGKDEEIRLWRNLFIISGMMNCVVVVAVTVSIVSCCGKTKSPNCDVKLQEVNGSQSWLPKAHNESSYTVVEFIPFHTVI